MLVTASERDQILVPLGTYFNSPIGWYEVFNNFYQVGTVTYTVAHIHKA